MARQFHRFIMKACAALCALTLGACVTTQGPGGSGDAAADKTGFTTALPAPAERKWPGLEADIVGQRSRAYGLVNFPVAEAYLNDLLAKIKRTAGVPDWPGRVYVVPSPALDAYATGAGNIYIAMSWLTTAESEDEIFALLAHEFGHVYLHYHSIDNVLAGTDALAQVALLGVALATRSDMGSAKLSTMALGYSVGREYGSSSWGKSQEVAADEFGMRIAVRAGYSYEYGFKTLLERLDTWETDNEQRKAAQEAAFFAEANRLGREKAIADAKARGQTASAALASQQGNTAEFSARMQKGVEKLTDAIKFENKHPPVSERIDNLAQIVDKNPSLFADQAPVVAPLKRLRQKPEFVEITKNYGDAFEAMRDVGSAKAAALVKSARKGRTRTHAYPVMAAYQVERYRITHGIVDSPAGATASGILLDNLGSAQNSAWRLVVTRVDDLKTLGQRDKAIAELDAAWATYAKGPYAWPDYISRIGELKGWDKAKALASACSSTFSFEAKACAEAALTPAERAEREQRSKQQGEQLANKMAGKLFK